MSLCAEPLPTPGEDGTVVADLTIVQREPTEPMISLAVVALISWMSLREHAPGRDVLTFYVLAWVTFFFVGLAGGYPLRLGKIHGGSPVDGFMEAFVFPLWGEVTQLLLIPALGPSLPLLAFLSVALIGRLLDRDLTRVARVTAIVLVVVPWVTAAMLSGEGPGPSQLGSLASSTFG
jgi:hypothetical protein